MDRIYDLQCEYKKNPMQVDIKNPRFSWKVQAEGYNVIQIKWELDVFEQISKRVVWSVSEESNRTVHIVYDGEPLQENKKYTWRVKSKLKDGRVLVSSGNDFFETGFFEEDIWKGIWIGKKDREDLGNCPLFRKKVEVKEKCTRAKLFISARGLYEVSVNGNIQDEYLLAPGWTNYKHHQQYLAYDVTDFINTGENVIGVRLGDGWYDGEISFNHQTHVYGNEVAFAAIIILEMDGKTTKIVTDSSWKTHESGIEKSSIYDGEIYDLTKESVKWNIPEYDDREWKSADIMEDTETKMLGMINEGTKRIDTIAPLQILHTPGGETLIDMGQNMTGWVRITIDGEEGDIVHIKHGEVLDKDGNFYPGNLRLAKQEDRYVLRKGHNILEPHFTFHGFRYIKILEFPKEVKCQYFEGIVLHTAMKPTMEFECSDSFVNQLWHNLTWGQKGNFLDVPTDCPQRDERLGWTGDAQIFCRTACYNFDSNSFFTKWLEDVKADQYENGAIPFVVPDVLPKDWRFLTAAKIGSNHTSAAWGDAITICPWTLYLHYGDIRILEKSYDSMKAYIDYIYNGSSYGSGNPYIWDWGPQLGDWLALDNEEGSYRGATDETYVATAYYAFSTNIVVKCAKILSKKEDEKRYTDLYTNIKDNFRKKYVKEGGITLQTQTAQILAIFFDLLENEEKKIAVETLVSMLKENENHLKTGFIGTPYLCHVLSDNGHSDIAYKLLMQKDFPSWLYQVTKGATTVWEHWDGEKPDGSFWSDNMNSFNHYAYGSIGEWLYRGMAGIDMNEREPGYEHIILKPKTNKVFSYISCSYDSIRGKIVSKWNRKDNVVIYHIEIPANTHATIYLEDGNIYEVGSGIYEYQIDIV